MTEISMSMYDLAMLIWLDEMGCDGCHTKRKYGFVFVNYYYVIITYL